MISLKSNILKQAFNHKPNHLSSLNINKKLSLKLVKTNEAQSNTKINNLFPFTSKKAFVHFNCKHKNNWNLNGFSVSFSGTSNINNCSISNKKKDLMLLKIQKNFFSKKFTKVKQNSASAKNLSAKDEKEAADDEVFVKPNAPTDKRDDKTGLNELEKMDERQIIQYYFELRNVIMDLYKGPNFKFFYFCFHLATSYLAINNLLQLYWMYQVFYGGSVIGICYLNYEFYSSATEKKFIDRVALITILLILLSFAIGVYSKFYTDSKSLQYSLYGYLLINLCFTLFPFLSKDLMFIIPRWILVYNPIYTAVMSALLGLGFYLKYNQTVLTEDSQIFGEEDAAKARIFLFNDHQIMHVKNTYANELTRIINQLNNDYLESIAKRKNVIADEDNDFKFILGTNKK